MGRPTKPLKVDHDSTYSDHCDTKVADEGFRSESGVGSGKRKSRIGERLSEIGERLNRSSLRVSLSAMNISSVKRNWLPPLVHLAYNPLTLSGLFLVNAAAVIWLFVLPVATREAARHPYLLIVFFGVLPIAFAIGLAGIPSGAYLRFRRLTRGGIAPRSFEPIGWDNLDFRRISLFVVGATCCNALIGGYVSQHTIHYMDSPGFCSTTCHSMAPQYIAYSDSPHRNIACVECHIGSGRRAYARAKLNGIWQVTATMFELYPTPIPTPLENLRPAGEICESCHWPQTFNGVQIRVVDHFASDSANTHTQTVLAMRVGGATSSSGIHGAHLAAGEAMEYTSDERRTEVFWVRHTGSSGGSREYWAPGLGEEVEREARTMDCLDCHTRPSHRFKSAGRALDEALAVGVIDPAVPWIRRLGLSALTRDYASAANAAERLPGVLIGLYNDAHPTVAQTHEDAILRAAQGLVEIFNRNVFPSMAIGWGTYPDHSGHSDSPGCFRCHGSSLRSSDGGSISADCSACHVILAMGESEPQILRQLGIDR